MQVAPKLFSKLKWQRVLSGHHFHFLFEFSAIVVELCEMLLGWYFVQPFTILTRKTFWIRITENVVNWWICKLLQQISCEVTMRKSKDCMIGFIISVVLPSFYRKRYGRVYRIWKKQCRNTILTTSFYSGFQN